MIYKRIASIREENGLSQKAFADSLGVSFRTIQNYERGVTSPNYDFLQNLSKRYNVSMMFLMGEDESDSPIRFANDSLVSLSQNDLSPEEQSNDFIKIPVFDDVYASAGAGLINEEQVSRYLDIAKSSLRDYFRLTSFTDLSIINAKGDSMLPTISPNCQLLVQKGMPREEQICVTRIDDELYVKRLQKLPRYKLISDNKNYDDIELDGREYEILGVVVGLFQKIT